MNLFCANIVSVKLHIVKKSIVFFITNSYNMTKPSRHSIAAGTGKEIKQNRESAPTFWRLLHSGVKINELQINLSFIQKLFTPTITLSFPILLPSSTIIFFYRFNIEVQHCCAKIVRIFVLVSRSSKVFWVGG